jgi:ribosomal protein S18 acetylase RimI-like enzyme
MTVDPLLDRIDAYCDAVPRTAARAEAHGSLTLFVNDGPGWPFYARPTRGTATVTPTDVDRVRARQRQLGIPETFEWIAEVTPSLGLAASGTGLAVTDHPLLVLKPAVLRPAPRPAGVQLRLVGPDDDLATITAVAHVGFAHPGTATGPVGAEALTRAAAQRNPGALGFERARLASGLTVMAVALLDGQPAAVGSHQPVGPVTEVVGVATLPVWRRRGLGAAVTAFLVQDAARRGAETVFLSAGDDAVARVYERLGFRRVGFHRAAEPPQPAGH